MNNINAAKKYPHKDKVTSIYKNNRKKHTENNEAILGHILELSSSEIYIFDIETLNFLFVNKRVRENLGYSMEELGEFTPLDIKLEFTLESFGVLISPLRASEKEVINFETIHQRKDGTFYSVDVHLQLLPYQGKLAFVATIFDITKRKLLEKLRNQTSHESLTELIDRREFELNVVLDTINVIGLGVVLIDSKRNILYSNKIANEICVDNEECFDTETLFYCRDQIIDSWLEKNIKEIIENGDDNNINNSPRAISVERALSNAPLLLMVSNYHHDLMSVVSYGVKDPLTIIFIGDPTRNIKVPTEMYIKLYGLSPSEAKVLHYIVNGMKVNHLAEHLTITVATVRKHLHNIFNKTHTTNQTELVRLVMSSSVWFNTYFH